MTRAVVASLTEVTRCTIALVEAVSDLKHERAVKRLEKKLGPWFKWQGRVLLENLPKLVRYFPQPVEESRLLEALGADFDSMFDSAIEVTVRNGEEIVQAGAYEGFAGGYTSLADEIEMQKSFSLHDPLATDWAKERAAEAISEVNDTTKDTIRGIVSKGIDEGMDYDTIAGRITKRFGEFAIGKPQQHIQSRAHLVAINENALAYERGQRQLVDEIQDAGIEMETSWATVGDGDVSAGCLRNQAEEWIPAGTEFSSGHLGPPRFPGCRCSSRNRVSRQVNYCESGGQSMTEAKCTPWPEGIERPEYTRKRPMDAPSEKQAKEIKAAPEVKRAKRKQVHIDVPKGLYGKEPVKRPVKRTAAQLKADGDIWQGGLSSSEGRAVNSWLDDYGDIRLAQQGKAVEGGLTQAQAEEAGRRLGIALDRAPVVDDVIYRGLRDVDDAAYKALITADEMTWDALSSASLQRGVGADFAGASMEGRSVVLEIASKTGRYFRPAGIDEVLMKAGTRYRRISVATDVNVTTARGGKVVVTVIRLAEVI